MTLPASVSGRWYLDLPCHASHVTVDVPRYIAPAAADVRMAFIRFYGLGLRSSSCLPTPTSDQISRLIQ
jgi:hypothetical protein